MIKVSRMTDYAVVVLCNIAQSKSALTTASALSAGTGLPEPTVAKVLKFLAKGKVLVSVRGVNGGYRLNVRPEKITVADIITAVDGPIALTACVEGSGIGCDYSCFCSVKGRWDHVNDAIRGALEDVTLAEMLRFPSAPPVKAGVFKKDSRLRGERI